MIMSKKVLIISTSPRKGSNSDALADEFAKGAMDAGNEVEKVSLIGKDIQFCRGCLACQKTKRCVIHDDADTIVQEKMLLADVLVFATPIYYYEMSGQEPPAVWKAGLPVSRSLTCPV
jgi:multimeric flavodoxin WrbA